MASLLVKRSIIFEWHIEIIFHSYIHRIHSPWSNFVLGGYIIFTVRKDVMEQDEFEFSGKFQELINGGKWQEVKKFLSDYVIGYENDELDVAKCYIVAYKVLKNE